VTIRKACAIPKARGSVARVRQALDAGCSETSRAYEIRFSVGKI